MGEPKESKKEEVREIKIQKNNPISCHICQAPFPSENLFKSHMITVHETEDVSTNKDDDWTLLDKATTPERRNNHLHLLQNLKRKRNRIIPTSNPRLELLLKPWKTWDSPK